MSWYETTKDSRKLIVQHAGCQLQRITQRDLGLKCLKKRRAHELA